MTGRVNTVATITRSTSPPSSLIFHSLLSLSDMDSDQRRRRKRPTKLLYSPAHFFSVRSLLLCLGFLGFLYFLSDHLRRSQSAFRPVLAIPSFSASSSYSIGEHSELKLSPSELKIEHRVLFPDHVMLTLSSRNAKVQDSEKLECVYSNDELAGSIMDALSVDDYDEFRQIVRCPLPPANCSSAVSLQRSGQYTEKLKLGQLQSTQTVHNWDNLAYDAKLDGDYAVVFVKGLNLRPDRESDASQFSCHFGLGNFALKTKAITAAQEVVRCALPRIIKKNPNKAQGIRVAIGVHDHVPLPSVAKISNSETEMKKKKKYELCACTMLWNQAPALREWVIYHSWLGIENWFIYDNNSDDNIKQVIEELQSDNYNITRNLWPWIKTQEAGFSHCVLRARDECNWVSFMDVDEFFYFPKPPHNQNALRNLVSNFSSSSSTIGEIRTTCHSFGPSGLRSPPKQGVTVGYTCRVQSPERHKSIVRPDALDRTLLNVVHHFHLRKGFKYLNLPQSKGVVNHYKYQVWESFRAKFFRRVATYVADWRENHNEGSRDRAPGLGTEAIEPPNWALQFCEVWDTGLRDFVLANLADPATDLLPWERHFRENL